MTRHLILGCLCAFLFAVGCASSPIAEGPLSEADFERWSVHVLTWDVDGDRRKTRVWIAAVGGAPYLRTGQTRWWQNIERGSKTRILSGDHVYPVSIEAVTDPSLRAKIDAGAEGTRFSITDPDGTVLIEGTFHGDDSDRNFPLMSARLFATDAVNPQFLTYSDGMSFTYSKELDAVIDNE